MTSGDPAGVAGSNRLFRICENGLVSGLDLFKLCRPWNGSRRWLHSWGEPYVTTLEAVRGEERRVRCEVCGKSDYKHEWGKTAED